MDGKVIYTLKIPSSARSLRHQAEKRGADLGSRRLSSQRTWNRGCPAHARPRPRQGPRPSSKPSPPIADKEDRAGHGKVMALHMWVRLEELSALPLRRGRRWSRRSGPSSEPCSSGWGDEEKPASPRPTSPSTAVEQELPPWRRCDDQLCRASVTALGAGHDFLKRRSGGVVGEGLLHNGSSAPPAQGVVKRLCGEGRSVALIQRVIRRHSRATGTATAPYAGRGAPPRCYPCAATIGIGWRARWIRFFLIIVTVRLVEV
ncbi:hypothetical protein GWK47_038711 [Chionoecetes opilio]|uniref:Uncharacterized protein n=1 Tax=Chionoecetes opilio TaxID=41210 RepID=A0A8J4YLC1_CHIOP|nr:hypothetical protein GWK47_038711 [Chionoecetes opilio]